MATLSVIVASLTKLVGQLPVGSDIQQAALKAASSLSKHVPAGSTSPGVENNAMMKLQREHMQQRPMAQQAAGAAQQTPQAAPAAAA